MNRLFLSIKYLIRPVCFFLVYLTLLISISSQGQKINSAKTDVTKSSNKRVIYGLASYYANKFNGRKTASGEIFSQNKLTCACNMLPLGTWVKITNVRNNRTVVVKVNDRLHPKMRRVADLSRSAASKLGYTGAGLVRVKVEVIGRVNPG